MNIDPRVVAHEAKANIRLLTQINKLCSQTQFNAVGRKSLALILAHASCSHGMALARLLHGQPIDFASSAIILLRAQFELLLKAGFMLKGMSDDEAQTYLKNSRFPARMGPDKKMVEPTLAMLAEAFDINFVAGDTQTKTHGYWKKAMNGHVHGGNVLASTFLTSSVLGANVPLSEVLEVIADSAVFSHMAFLVMMDATPDPRVSSILHWESYVLPTMRSLADRSERFLRMGVYGP